MNPSKSPKKLNDLSSKQLSTKEVPINRKSLLNDKTATEKKVNRSTKNLPKTPISKGPIYHKRTLSQVVNKQIINAVNTNNYVNINISDSEKVINCLKDSMKIFEKIQKDFEHTAIDSRIKEIEIKNILKTILITDYSYISDFEKRLITDQIIESSEHRIKNYKNLFTIINTSIKDLRKYFIGYFYHGKLLLYIEEKQGKRISHDQPNYKGANLPYDDDPAGSVEDTIDDCNFEETDMHEKGLALEKLRQLSRKRTKKTKFNIPNIQNEKMHFEEKMDTNNETVIDYIHNFNNECILETGEKVTLKPNDIDENMTTNYTSRKENEESKEKCFIF
jgi:hypothetical protein